MAKYKSWGKIQGRNEVLTRPIPSPSVADNVNSTWTVGFNHLINLSSPLRKLSKACACPRNTSNMVSGVLQTFNATANGWVCRSCFVRFLYSPKAALNIRVKLEEDEDPQDI